MFQEYASFINKKLGYNIKTLGNKEEDFKESNLEYKENLSTYKSLFFLFKNAKINTLSKKHI